MAVSERILHCLSSSWVTVTTTRARITINRLSGPVQFAPDKMKMIIKLNSKNNKFQLSKYFS